MSHFADLRSSNSKSEIIGRCSPAPSATPHTAKDAQESQPSAPRGETHLQIRYFSIMRDSFFPKINFTELRFCFILIITLPGKVTAPRGWCIRSWIIRSAG